MFSSFHLSATNKKKTGSWAKKTTTTTTDLRLCSRGFAATSLLFVVLLQIRRSGVSFAEHVCSKSAWCDVGRQRRHSTAAAWPAVPSDAPPLHSNTVKRDWSRSS